MTTSAIQLHDTLRGYFGSKDAGGVAERTIRLYPAHSIYIELFLGGGAVLRRKQPALRSIGVDIDPEVIVAWGQVNYPGLELVNGCGIAFIGQYTSKGGLWLPNDALVNSDPTYVHATRTSRKRYKFELTDDDHVRLIDALDDLGCSVFLHGYPSALYDQNAKLKNWRRDELPAMTRGGKRIEVIWSKTTVASFAIERRHHGRDFRERERLKRKRTRWANKFKALPPGERAIILQELLEVDVAVANEAIEAVGQTGGRR